MTDISSHSAVLTTTRPVLSEPRHTLTTAPTKAECVANLIAYLAQMAQSG